MLKIDEETLKRLEIQYPGIRESILFLKMPNFHHAPIVGLRIQQTCKPVL
jgi:hypothetical protein